MTTRQDERGSCGSDEAMVPHLPHTSDMANFLVHPQQQQLHHSHHQQQGQPPPPMMWPQQQHMSPTFPPHHQHHQQPSLPQQQQIFNEYMYNVAYSPAQTETYSVLPMQLHLKVYHCADNLGSAPAAVNESNAALFAPQNAAYPHINIAPLPSQLHQPTQPQQPPTPQQQQPTPPMQAQFYELFATNPLLPNPEMNIAVPSQQQQQQQHHHQQHQQQQAPSFRQFEEPRGNAATSTANSSSNLFNNLVSNWSPNLTGGTYTQFGAEITDPNTNRNYNESPMPVQQQQHHQQPPLQQQQQQQQYNVKAPVTLASSPSAKTADKFNAGLNLASNTASTKTNNVVSGLPETKKRIVAEVKPMPMSYSDVLSKGTLRSMANTSNSGEGRISNGLDANLTQSRRQGVKDEVSHQTRSSKRSPLHEAKDAAGGAMQSSTTNAIGNSNGNRNKKRGHGHQASSQKIQQAQQIQQQAPNKSTKPQPLATQDKKRLTNTPTQLKTNSTNNSNGNSSGYSVKSNDNTNKATASNNNNNAPASAAQQTTRKTNVNKMNNTYNASNGNYSNANNTGNSSNTGNNNNSSNNNSSSSSKRYYNSTSSNTNLNSNSGGYSYSSKRNRGNAYSSNSPSHASSTPNRNYELAKRILHTWWIWTLKLLTWLFYLVYDIVVLGCSMAYERLTTAYIAGLAYAQQLHKELKQNSGKPSIWWRNYWRRFDARFKKNSCWAFWRRFYKRKPPEPPTEAFKTGRLPQTGEEAMFSLLNCKGKDAYSILGLPPDSPQEQVRKHYKKIAVLVHPDKNKQAGAEEAFKVLQRAFELIGEPENRLAYDQSLAEALHAEKAWTELHDLLSQLQTKMTEAANTIRCSTCAQRHPRKLTERPHYAARECASCKIRHSAKDGDIWAETSMLGLRWKYLALMDGKVYDITEWANCQKGALSHLEPNSHMVQYRIVRGAQQQQQHQQQQQQHQQQQQQQQQQNHQHHQQHQHERGGHHHGGVGGVSGVSEATLHEFLDNLYSGQHPGGAPNATPFANNTRRRARRN